MSEGLQGTWEAIRKLEDIGGVNGRFIRQSLRTALRNASKRLQGIMFSVVKTASGLTRSAIKVRSGPRSRTGISMLVGVFGSAKKDGKFYAGFANFGHKTPSGSEVKGDRWTDSVVSAMPAAQEEIVLTLQNELKEIASQ